jgi:hypothetical protein
MFEVPGRRQEDNDVTLLPTASKSPPPAAGQRRRPRPGRYRWWHWLIVIAVVIPLLTPLYNRLRPQLFGLPFFYWSQMAFIGLAACVTTVVYQATKRRGS